MGLCTGPVRRPISYSLTLGPVGGGGAGGSLKVTGITIFFHVSGFHFHWPTDFTAESSSAENPDDLTTLTFATRPVFGLMATSRTAVP